MRTVAGGLQLRNDGQGQSWNASVTGPADHGGQRVRRIVRASSAVIVEKLSPLSNLVDELCRKHEYLYISTFGNYTFVWRPLTRGEYYRLAVNGNGLGDVYCEICRLAVLHPEDLDFYMLPGGVVTQLATKMLSESGFGDTERILSLIASFRESMSSFERQAECLVATAFPQIRFEEMMEWPLPKLIDYAVRAEWVLNNIHHLPVQFARTDGTKDKKGKQKPNPAELRKQGIDPMRMLDPSTLRPRMVHDLLIVGTGGWRMYQTEAKANTSPFGKGGAVR